jgi:hypothetical protein
MSRTIRLFGILSVVLFGSFQAAQAGDCRDAGVYAAKLKEIADKLCADTGNKWQGCTKLDGVVAQAAGWVKAWNDLVGNSWATIGPRSLSYNAKSNGTILNPGTRVWASVGPSAGAATVKFSYKSGQAGMQVSYCAVNSAGGVDFLGSEEVGAGKQLPQKNLTAAQVGGKFILIKLDGTGGAGKKYQYDVTLEGDLLQ